MSLDVPIIANGHPNRMPIKGILVRLDQPSDAAPHGSNGKRVLLTTEAAEKAIPSLLGMALDLTVDLDGHDPTKKIGIITAAHVENSALMIEGYVWASDFPRQALQIHLNQASLGFSFEAQQIAVESLETDPLVITDCVFTGAAILMKDAAAYRTTALAAAAAKKHEAESKSEFVMDEETKKVLADLMASAVAPVHTAIDGIKSDLAAQGEKVAYLHDKVEANAATMSKVEPLASKLESCAASMEAAGVGLEPSSGHVFHLRKIAGDMRAQAALGRMPSSYSGGMGYYASADVSRQQPGQPVYQQPVAPVQVQASAQPKFEDSEAFRSMKATLDSLSSSLTETKGQLQAAQDKAASLETKLTDVQAAGVRQIAEPPRRTISPHLQRLLAKEGIGEGSTDTGEGMKLSASQVNKMLEGLPLAEKIKLKGQMAAQNLIDPSLAY